MSSGCNVARCPSAASQWLCIVELGVSTGYNVAGCSSAAGQWLGAE